MTEADEPPPLSDESLVKVCRLLNEEGVRYLIVGGFAVILHQIPRFTHDVDVLVPDDEDNFRHLITALSKLEDGAAAELSPEDLRDNLVVKIADEIEVDVSRRAWVVTYDEALPGALEEVYRGVRVPYIGLNDLIRSKQTHRDKDRIDIQMLRAKHFGDTPTNKGCGGLFVAWAVLIGLGWWGRGILPW
jgi:predicted nucleotidyltransferase